MALTASSRCRDDDYGVGGGGGGHGGGGVHLYQLTGYYFRHRGGS